MEVRKLGRLGVVAKQSAVLAQWRHQDRAGTGEFGSLQLQTSELRGLSAAAGNFLAADLSSLVEVTFS